MPRVGSSRIRTRGSRRASGRAPPSAGCRPTASDLLLDGGRLDGAAGRRARARQPALGRRSRKPERGDPLRHAERDVVAHAAQQQERLLLAVFGHEADAGQDGVGRGCAGATGRPRTSTSPARRRSCRRSRAPARSARRRPARPGPRTSPARTMKRAVADLARSVTPRTSSATSPAGPARDGRTGRPGRGRPCRRTMSASSSPAAGSTATSSPSRRIATRSARSHDFAQAVARCRRSPTPSARSAATMPNRRCASSSVERGGRLVEARAGGTPARRPRMISISCRCAGPRPRQGPAASMRSLEPEPGQHAPRARPRSGPVDERPGARWRSPMKMFSATESSGMISGSWWMTRMPASCASRGATRSGLGGRRPGSSPASGAMLALEDAQSASTCRRRSRRPAPVTSPARQVQAHALERLDHAEPLGDRRGARRGSRDAPGYLHPAGP